MAADARRSDPPAEQKMTNAEFLAFTASRPNRERGELIEGRPK